MRPSKLTEEVRRERTRYLEKRLYETELPTTADLANHLSAALPLWPWISTPGLPRGAPHPS